MAVANRYISTSNVSQTDLSSRLEMIEGGERRGSDLLSGSTTIKVIAYRADAPLPSSWAMTSAHSTSNYTIELQIGEREKIGQGTFG